jgi:A/G-specific adenine glycosylase
MKTRKKRNKRTTKNNPTVPLDSGVGVFLPDAVWFRAFRRRLSAWYTRNARPLPWRRSRDPYAVWLSEIMLQQTQAASVVGVFDRFLEIFPTIDTLAGADERAVLRLWEGLGYYRRARQLHETAKILVARHDGRFPQDFETVRSLPGIGRYTAGAVLSIAFDAMLPILEANTVRLHCRLTGYDGDPHSAVGRQFLWAMAEAALPRRGAGRFNQALMELGAQVCAPRAPRCEACPASVLCRAHRENRQQEIPRPKTKKSVESVREAAVVVRRGRRVLLMRRPPNGRWAGLWDFPRFSMRAESPTAARVEIAENVLAMTGIYIAPRRRLETFTHGVTRFRITLECHEAEYLACKGKAAVECLWLRPDELDDYPLCSTGRKLAKLIK